MKDNKVFISYCSNNNTEADRIDNVLQGIGVTAVRDKRDLKFKDSIREFMKRIRKTDHVIMLISDDFLTSRNCMYEVLEFVKDEDFKERILPIIIKDTKIFNSIEHAKYISFWENKAKEIENTIKSLKPEDSIKLAEELRIIKHISNTIQDFLHVISNMKCLKYEDTENNNFFDIFKEIGYEYIELLKELLEIENINDLDLQESRLEEFLTKYPKHKAANYKKVMLAYERKQFKKARICLENFVSNIDDSDETILNTLGVILMKEFKEYTKAENYFRKVIKINPESDIAYTNLGLLYHDYLKDYKKAKECFINAINIDATNDCAYNNLARIYADIENNYKEARKYYELAILINPSNANAHYNLGLILEHHYNDLDNATNEYIKSVELDPNNLQAHFRLAVNYVQYIGDFEKAREHYEIVTKKDPNNYVALSNLGFVYHVLKMYEEEEIVCLNAIKINPDYAGPRNSLGILYMHHLNSPNRAKVQLEKCIDLEPQNPVFHLNYALLNYYFKDSKIVEFDLAREHYIKAKSLDPNIANPELDEYYKVNIIY